MSRIIAIFDGKTGQIHGFRDLSQAAEFLDLETSDLKEDMRGGGTYYNGKYASDLILHKSNRGGKRS